MPSRKACGHSRAQKAWEQFCGGQRGHRPRISHLGAQEGQRREAPSLCLVPRQGTDALSPAAQGAETQPPVVPPGPGAGQPWAIAGHDNVSRACPQHEEGAEGLGLAGPRGAQGMEGKWDTAMKSS